MIGTPHVTFLSTGLGKGGAETQLVALARHLQARGWRTEVITIVDPRSFVDDLAKDGIEVRSLGVGRGRVNPLAGIRFGRMLARDRPDVLVTFMYHANVLGRLVGRLAGVPVIVGSIRNEHFGGRWRERIEHWTEPLADCTIINSRMAASSLVDRGVVRPSRLRVIPNGVRLGTLDTRQENPGTEALRTEIGVGKHEFLWLAVGHLEDQKDYPCMFEGFRRLLVGDVPVQLRIAGEGSRYGELSELIGRMGIGDRVRLIGLRQDIPALLQAADAYVLSSAWEGMPNAVMEALAGARPVVSTRVGGVAELVRDGVSGFLVPSHDPVALANAMDRLDHLPVEIREAMGLEGRRDMEEKYDFEKSMQAWDDLLSALIGRSHMQSRGGCRPNSAASAV